MSKNVGIFQFNGCNKCFNETLLLHLAEDVDDRYSFERIETPSQWDERSLDIAVITGFLLPEDLPQLEKIKKNSSKLIAFGSCSATGGIYGLNYQKGIKVTPLKDFISESTEILGCLGEWGELIHALDEKSDEKPKNLCDTCKRKSTCDYLDEVHRQFDIYTEDAEKCFNDFGLMCAGYVAHECKERCIDFGTPCRGCKPSIERSGFRMIGLFGTLMANVEVASEPTGKGGTDKLADDDDEITEGNPDNTGNFFRHTLADAKMPIGRGISTGNLTNNIFIDRAIEELPVIAGSIGGEHSISLTLDIIEALEKGMNMEISETVSKYRTQLKTLESSLINTITEKDFNKYHKISTEIRELAGNRNLSNLFFGGYKVPLESEDDFDAYKYQIFEVQEGTYQSGSVSYTLDSKGLVTEFNWEGN